MIKLNKVYDFIIIGAGISGLHIGALLSRHGSVLILEKSKVIGGRARVVDLEGFKLDFGPHPVRFGPNSALAKSLKNIGKSIKFIKPGNSWAFLSDGTKTIFPTGGILPVLKSKMVPFFKTLKLLLKIKGMEKKDFHELYDVSLEKWFEKEVIAVSIRKFLRIASGAMQVNPFVERSSSGELLHNIQRVLKNGSVYYPKGGWGTIFSNFKEVIKKNKGEIRVDNEVSKILIENNTAIGVKLGNEDIKGNKIISTVPAQSLFNILDEGCCKKDFIDKCKNLRPTAGISIDFCLSEPVSDIKGLIFFDDPLAFGYIPTNLDKSIAPKGSSIMNFLTILNVEEIKSAEKIKNAHLKLREKILSVFPNIENYLLHERPLSHPMVDGVEVNIHQHKLKRPKNTIDTIENLYLTGDSIDGEGAGGDIGHTSVRECYEKIISP
jgi:phytoene dehydrogenase-like protein